jgi:hypothetical protein
MQHAVDDRRVQGEANAERDVKAKLMQLMDTRSMRIDFCFVRGEVNALSSDVVMDRPITTSDKKKKKKKTKNAGWFPRHIHVGSGDVVIDPGPSFKPPPPPPLLRP